MSLKNTANKLANSKFGFIGCGVMAESMIKGLLDQKLVLPEQISASHPREKRRDELVEKYSINMFSGNPETARRVCAGPGPVVLLCVKPQRLKEVLEELAGSITAETLIISIVAGATSAIIGKSLGIDKIVRCMPNTPSQIGYGMAVWTATGQVTANEKEKVEVLMGALGREMYVENEHMVDMATSLSATGPTYTFLVMEALTDAGVHLGFSRDVSKTLVQETMLGAVKFAMDSNLHPAELRNMVTSPGGTSADAIYEMEKGGLRTVLSKAVFAAYKKAVRLGNE